MFNLVLIFSYLLNKLYGYEGLNLLFRILPSSQIVKILKRYGANIGANVRIQNPLTIHNADRDIPIFKNLIIGDNVYVGRHCFLDLADTITIQNNVTISHYCVINTHTDAGKSPLSITILPISKSPVSIKQGAYIGVNVTILEGIDIGETSLIAAGSLVNKSIEPHSVFAGVPAKKIR